MASSTRRIFTLTINKNINDVIKVGYLTEARPTTQYGREWLSEIWFKALDDKFEEKVNADAWGYACDQKTKLAIGSREVSLLTVEELEMGQRGIADTVASYLDINIDTIVESSEVKTLVDEFVEAHYLIMGSESVDLWGVLSLARLANAKMLDKLRDLISRYSIENLIESVLRNRECLLKLESVMV
jgi:hypothetical protein